jgi:hypothetical protein
MSIPGRIASTCCFGGMVGLPGASLTGSINTSADLSRIEVLKGADVECAEKVSDQDVRPLLA